MFSLEVRESEFGKIQRTDFIIQLTNFIGPYKISFFFYRGKRVRFPVDKKKKEQTDFIINLFNVFDPSPLILPELLLENSRNVFHNL